MQTAEAVLMAKALSEKTDQSDEAGNVVKIRLLDEVIQASLTTPTGIQGDMEMWAHSPLEARPEEWPEEFPFLESLHCTAVKRTESDYFIMTWQPKGSRGFQEDLDEEASARVLHLMSQARAIFKDDGGFEENRARLRRIVAQLEEMGWWEADRLENERKVQVTMGKGMGRRSIIATNTGGLSGLMVIGDIMEEN